jgi:cellulose synthase/poly-beta-1,6-N-acetylglucosamine synthase-like glycosyltransferase
MNVNMENRVLEAMRPLSSDPASIEHASAGGSSLTCSVIIPVCRGGATFQACLTSVFAAIQPGDEVIVVADGEGDGSWRIAERMGARIAKRSTSGGPGLARNLGAETSRSDILFFVDADVTIPPDAVKRVRSAFEEEKDVAAVIGSYDEEPGERNFHSQFKNLFHHFVHQNGSAEASTFWGACGGIRREIFLKLGGFDQTYGRPSIEDIEFGYRLKAASQRIRLLPDLQVKHLKRWDVQSLIRTDMLDRAAPWTELIWDHFIRQKPRVLNDLNLGLAYRLSLISSFLLIAVSVASFFTRWAWPLVLVFGSLFVWLNFPFFKFFKSKRGGRFAFRALAWRFGYDIYSGMGFCYGSFRFANVSTRRILSEAYAKLDPVALGAAGGSLLGGWVFAATVILLAKGGEQIGTRLALLGQFLPSYSVTWPGSVIGLLYGFAIGFLFGFFFACFRNTAMKLHLGSRRMQRFLNRVRQSGAPS